MRREGESFYSRIDEAVRDIRTEVMVLPQFGSAGNPDLSMDARGTITGLTIHTKAEEIYRAILEGMAFQMYLPTNVLKSWERRWSRSWRREEGGLRADASDTGRHLQYESIVPGQRGVGYPLMHDDGRGRNWGLFFFGGRHQTRGKDKKNICRTPGCMSTIWINSGKYKMLYEKMHDFK